MVKKRICPLCGSCFGMDQYLYDANGIWYHWVCGNKVFEKADRLKRREKIFIKRMAQK
jgi:hypothetical protein